jgi:antibiotic biosynthesis monooxygenase (ABM) superfamily enzyme
MSVTISGTARTFYFVAINCRHEEEEEFNAWYGSVHMPLSMKYAGLLSATRYGLLGGAGSQAQYLTIFEFRDRAAMDGFLTSPEVSAARDDLKLRWTGAPPFVVNWRGQYEPIRTWGGETKMNRFINIVATECHPEDEKKFNEWYNGIHVPMLFKYPGMMKVTRHRLTGGSEGQARYLAVYEFKDRAAFEGFEKSAEMKAAREEMQQTWKDRMFSIKWRAQYDPIQSWEK